MKAILTSALGGYIKTADGRIPDTLLEANGLWTPSVPCGRQTQKS